jgi:hypothetical protein
MCRIGAERRKTAAGSPKGERSESIYRRIYGSGLAMNTTFDGMEGQRPRLTHFSSTAARNRFQTALLPKPLEPLAAHAPDK